MGLREEIACIEFCWGTCGDVALVCQKQLECDAFADRQNPNYGHPTLDYRKADQISAFIKKAGYVKLVEGDKVICKTAWDLLSPAIKRGLEVAKQETGLKLSTSMRKGK